ncbi:MAG: pyridoxal phosphate-dependent aminotransferase, partial [Alphaproteobacteria bacterium]
MARPLSKRGDVATFLAMDVYAQATALAQQGREIIHLEVGQPATAAPKLVREYAKELIDNSLLAYSDATGIGKVRQRIAQYYADHYNIDLDP